MTYGFTFTFNNPDTWDRMVTEVYHFQGDKVREVIRRADMVFSTLDEIIPPDPYEHKRVA